MLDGLVLCGLTTRRVLPAIPPTWRSPTTVRPGVQPTTLPPAKIPKLCAPGHTVVALWEVVGMAGCPRRTQRALSPAILSTCPPGEGIPFPTSHRAGRHASSARRLPGDRPQAARPGQSCADAVPDGHACGRPQGVRLDEEKKI
ncbi:hypothetical protein GCM10029964_090320 [Kibdelosporangium lantanae]